VVQIEVVAMQVHESLIELVGNTPLVRLHAVTQAVGGGQAPAVLAKVEYFNPGGSVKDRIALRMVEAAEASGALRAGGRPRPCWPRSSISTRAVR
jgi:cystathionine beta-synthase